jgi:hypothetical protein
MTVLFPVEKHWTAIKFTLNSKSLCSRILNDIFLLSRELFYFKVDGNISIFLLVKLEALQVSIDLYFYHTLELICAENISRLDLVVATRKLIRFILEQNDRIEERV